MYKYPVVVEFEDVDIYGIVHHTKILAYLERARVHFLEENGLDVKLSKIGLVLVDLKVRFKKPLQVMDRINIEVKVKELERLKFTWDYTIINNGKVSVKAEIEQVCIDLDTMRIMPVPDDLYRILGTLNN